MLPSVLLLLLLIRKGAGTKKTRPGEEGGAKWPATVTSKHELISLALRKTWEGRKLGDKQKQ